jgi:hypothetical protein
MGQKISIDMAKEIMNEVFQKWLDLLARGIEQPEQRRIADV